MIECRKEDHEKRLLAEELKASEQKYRDLFERVKHGLLITTIEGSVVDCNQAMLDQLGYDSKEELLNIDITRDLYVDPRDRKRFQQEIKDRGQA